MNYISSFLIYFFPSFFYNICHFGSQYAQRNNTTNFRGNGHHAQKQKLCMYKKFVQKKNISINLSHEYKKKEINGPSLTLIHRVWMIPSIPASLIMTSKKGNTICNLTLLFYLIFFLHLPIKKNINPKTSVT